MSLRVVNLGLPKTGTTTLARALKVSGFKVADHRVRPKQTVRTELHDAYVGELIYLGYFETGDPMAYMKEFTAISEMSCLRDGHSLWPQMDFGVIEALRKHHPDVKFVATRRDAFETSQSMLAWSDLGLDRLPDGAIPGLPAGFGDISKQREQWIDAHYAHLSTLFRDDPAYLELDIADERTPALLSEHLKTDITWWGKANAGPKNKVA